MKKISLLITIVFLIISGSLVAQVTDKDGNSYSTVQIGSQLWMAANLNVSHFRNGDIIPEIVDSTTWAQASSDGKPAWCYYNNDPVDGRTYCKLYNWYAVNDQRGLAPYGWHIPSSSEWANLTDYLGGEDVAGGKMKSTSAWNNNGNGTNESGFAGLPGSGRFSNGTFGGIGHLGDWWSSSESSKTNASDCGLDDWDGHVGRGNYDKGDGYSVRCVRD